MIYLDHNATSPLLPEVLEEMRPWLGVPANPSSVHRAGQAAAAAVERAREDVAALVGGVPQGVVFTSGATEANQTFLRGVAGRLVTSAVEHPSVLAARQADRLPVGADGVVSLDDLPADTAVLSVMAANHETGAIQPLKRALAAARAVGALLHVDATQAAGRMPLSLGEVDGVVLSAHKLGGPVGVGALILRSGDAFPPLLTGGAQERGRRAGTVNVAGVVGFAAACRLARDELSERTARWWALTGALRARIRELGGRVVAEDTVPNTTCAVFPGLRGESLVQALDLGGICVSSGAACASGSLDPSPVLLAMDDPEPGGALRISLGPRTSRAEVEALVATLPAVLHDVRTAAAWE